MNKYQRTILELFRDNPHLSFTPAEIFRELGVPRSDRDSILEAINAMANAGKIRKINGTRFSLQPRREEITGRLSRHREGYGFVIPDNGGEDLFVPARELRSSLHGDRVLASIEPRRTSGRSQGRIVRTLERGYSTLVGRFEAAGFVIPDEQRITGDIVIPRSARGKARGGEVVVVEITTYPSDDRAMEGKIIEVLGRPEDHDVEVLTIIRKHGLPHVFPANVLSEAGTFPQSVTDADLAGRKDLRDVLTVTIDGETARDFDDAVSVRREENGGIRLLVSIADVSHYVKSGSLLDIEALIRGTSVYFPDRCIPMLPEALSNGICSLNPREDRLAVTAEMLFDFEGNAQETLFYPSVIRSDERLTYTAVKEILVDGNLGPFSGHNALIADLKIMEELGLRLMEKRRRRGSIDFDLPEPEIILDLQGKPESIGRAERNIAHRIIEEFMLAANEATASFLTGRDMPCLYRVHEAPDPLKLKDFLEFIRPFGRTFRMKGDRVDPSELQRLLSAVAGEPEEKMVNEVLLRCMKQARYSAENIGHFGLASPCYTHFTSPIRRYPDLVVHRILKGVLAETLKKKDVRVISTELPEIAELTSNRERRAMEAEREIIRLKRLQYMESRVGEEFDGFVTGVTSYGLYVELTELLVEGLVHVSALGDDFYRHMEKQHVLVGERSGRRFRIGDRVRVKVAAVSQVKRRIELSLVEDRKRSPASVKGNHKKKTPRTSPAAPQVKKEKRGRTRSARKSR